jgi:hypothetical protein
MMADAAANTNARPNTRYFMLFVRTERTFADLPLSSVNDALLIMLSPHYGPCRLLKMIALL